MILNIIMSSSWRMVLTFVSIALIITITIFGF